MFVRENDGIIAVYRNFDLMLESMKRPSEFTFLHCSDYIIELNPENIGYGRFVKDRSGLFTEQKSVQVRKLLELINFLYEREKE